ncbi:IS110 family transposase [Actinomadura sp. KC06]|uniref:IS110 family transposase n=1 Tax=Actinomadura sp. KC06 TaxID=2530369 RepID=UPI001047DAD4|nr:IS110 family transposase [Actinomadura sp. KC06]TDD25587.1 IS110 family transposase [Actinomadura sp. KC06]
MARAGRKVKKRRIVGGVDTHADTHHAAVELMNGGRIADAQFPATSRGYARLLEWMRSFGRLHAVGVEGTGSYGAGLSRHLRDHDVRVVEVNRPDRRQRRNAGKSDPLDAYAAADAVLAGRARALPKSMDGIIETIRAVHVARSGAIKARTACINELRSLLITAPARLREQLAGLSAHALTTACARLRPGADLADPLHGTKLALRGLARRYQALTHEITDLDTHLQELIAQTRPDLLTIIGVGPEIAAQLLITCGDNPDRLTSADAFATLCGAAPVPASSGKTNRHRLSRGGDRQANRALFLIVLSRMAWCPRTKAYITRRTSEGKSKKEIIRCLKRYTARELFKALTRPTRQPHTSANAD